MKSLTCWATTKELAKDYVGARECFTLKLADLILGCFREILISLKAKI